MRHPLVNLLLVLVLFYLFVLQVQAVWPFTIDDMYISLRYAKHWVAGQGLVWNIGELPVEGYSNFSFVVLARVALLLGFDPVVMLKGAGVIGLFCTCLAVYAITRMWFLTRLALIPCLWLLIYKGQILWSVSGLETTVYQALICTAVFFIFRGMGYSSYPHIKGHLRPLSFISAGIFLALAGMTRPEAPALMLLFMLLLFLNRPSVCRWPYGKNVALFCGTFFVCFAPYFFWRWHYYGRLFPNPVYCKGLTNFVSFTLDKNYLHVVWPFALLAVPAIRQSKDIRHYFLWLPSVVYLILLTSADPVVAFYNRLFLPAFVLLLPLTLQGIQYVLSRFLGRDEWFDGAIYVCAFFLAFFYIPLMTLGGYRHFTENPVAGEQIRHHVAVWLGRHISPKSHVVLADSGLIPYQSPHPFIDSYCLNNAEMTKFTTASMYQRVCESVLETKPEVIILSALVEDGKAIYTPADACFAVKLTHNIGYCLQTSFETEDRHSFYRYEIFRMC